MYGTSIKRPHQHSTTVGTPMRVERVPGRYASTWDGLQRVCKDVKAVTGEDHRCGEHGPRRKPVTLPHVSILDDENSA